MTVDEQELTQEQLDVIDKVEKLLRLAARNTNAEEAASANAKAQELLVAYNLQELDVSGDEERSARRERVKIRGGMFQYQRDLWRAIAELNFCLHFVMEHAIWRSYPRRDGSVDEYWGKEFRHHVIGRVVNVAATRAMGGYLEQTIERLVRERYPLNTQRFLSEAVAYREGIAEQIEIRLRERRRDQEAERRRSEAQRARSGVASTSNALTIADYAQSERDANMDEIYGEGWSARRREERRQRAEANRRAAEEYTRWAEANPEEARRQEEQRRKEQRRRSSGGPGSRGGTTARDRRRWTSEYAQGYDVGKSVGLDPQADDRKSSQRRLS